MKFAETVKKIVEKELSVYHGGSDTRYHKSVIHNVKKVTK